MRFTALLFSKIQSTHQTSRRPAKRRFAVQSLERRELLAGDLFFNATTDAPYRVVEGKTINGAIQIESPALVDLEVQLELIQASPQASLGFSEFVESKIVTIPAGETQSSRFLVAAVRDDVRDGEHDVVLSASLSGYNDLMVDFRILDAQAGNVPPVIDSLGGLGFMNAVLPGDVVSLSGTFDDSDGADVHQVTVDWGDGQSEVLLASQVNQESDSFGAGHVYATPGVYDVAVTVTDGEDTDTENGRAAVVGITLSNEGVVEVVGASGEDRVEVKKAKRGKYYVAAKFDGFGKQYRSFKSHDVSGLSVITGPGRDHVRVHSKVKVDAVIKSGAGDDVVEGGDGNTTVFAGAGDDVVVTRRGDDKILGGRGNDVLSAGSGDDIVQGGPGFNILIGGRGTDVLVTAGEDIVIGGVMRDESKVCKLVKVMDYWTSGDAFQERVDAIVDEFSRHHRGHRHHHRRGHGRFVTNDRETDTFRNVDPDQRQWFFADKYEVTNAGAEDIVS
ncbi:MAG: PKD domain-containing protein [Rubripirellula sp.]